jgi:hypothetical protein
LVFCPDLLELIEQGLITDSKCVRGALSIAAGGYQNLGNQLALDLD